MIENTKKDFSPHEAENDPFVVPGQPVILKKVNPRFPDECLYFLFEADHGFSKNGHVETYTIRYRNILKPTSNHTRCSYSIIVRKKSSLKLCNESNTKGLDFEITPRGIGIGSVILNHLFRWAKENHPDLKPPSIYLSPNDEYDLENKERRNALYRNIGLIESKAKKISDLTPSISKRGFEVIELKSFLKTMLEKNDHSEYKIEKLERVLKNHRKNFISFYREYRLYFYLFYGSWGIAILLIIKFFDRIKLAFV